MKWGDRALIAIAIAAMGMVAYGQYLHREKVDTLIIANVAVIKALASTSADVQRSCKGRAL